MMVEKAKEDELPISPKPDSPVPEIFSSKKIFFLNSSYSGSRRSEIPHLESDYCPRDEVSRRLFPRSSDSCDCDCVSDGCWGCLRRNKQSFFKFFVLALSIALILLLFGSLSYNLTRGKALDESTELEKTEWISHYHEYPASEEKEESSKGSGSLGTQPILDLPVPVYENSDEYDSREDSRKLQYDENPAREFDKIEAISFSPFSKHNIISHNATLIIYDEREPMRVKKSLLFRREAQKTDVLKEKFRAREESARPEKPLLGKLEMKKFWESYFRNKVMSKSLRLRSDFLGTEENSVEEEAQDELKIGFLNEYFPVGFYVTTKAKSWNGQERKPQFPIGMQAANRKARKTSSFGAKVSELMGATGSDDSIKSSEDLDESAADGDYVSSQEVSANPESSDTDKGVSWLKQKI